VGDFEFQEKCLGKMSEVASQGRTVLFVSHNLGMVESLCERTIILKQGCVDDDGETRAVIQNYIQSDEVKFESGIIADIHRKTSDGNIWLEDVVVENSSGAHCSSVGVGEAISFVFTVHAWNELNAPQLAVGVDDQMGRRLMTLATDMDPEFVLQLKKGKQTKVRCTVPELTLMPGRYHITVALRWRGELVDGLEKICPFDVVSRDFFGTGRELRSNQGVVACRSSWTG